MATSALASLPSFSPSAFAHTAPQTEYKQVHRIGEQARAGCRPVMVRQPVHRDKGCVMLIEGVDKGCRTNVKFKSTDFKLPFIYDDEFRPAAAVPKPTPAPGPPPPVKMVESITERERKRQERESERKVEVAVQPERKRPKREAERRAEAFAKMGR